MRSKGLTTLILILFIKIISGQQNGLGNNQNFDFNNILLQQQVQKPTLNNPYLNTNGNENVLQKVDHKTQMQLNIPQPLLNTEQILQPPDLQQELPELHQFLLQPQPLQIKQSLRLQQPLQLQQPLHAGQPLQTHQSSQLQHPLEAHQPSQIQQPRQAHQTLQLQQPLQSEQSLQLQQPLQLQQNIPQQLPMYQQNVDLGQKADHQQTHFQAAPDFQLNYNIIPANPQAINVGQTQMFSNQPQQNSFTPPVETVFSPQQTDDKPFDVSSIKYHFASQRPSSPSLTNNAVVSNYPSIAIIPSFNINSVDQSKAIHSIPVLPSVITTPSYQNSNTQRYYYNQQSGDPRQNLYVNQNAGFSYPQQSPIPTITTVQNQPTAALVPRQSSILSSIPLSLIGAPSLIPQYTVSSTYPVNTIIGPAYTSQTPRSSNFKSFLPLIFNLLKEKLASNGCRNGCQNECNECKNNKPEVSSGYSNKKHYGALNEDDLLIPKNLSEEVENSGCLRERKNCVKIEKVIPNSDETEEDEESDEEDCEDDEDED